MLFWYLIIFLGQQAKLPTNQLTKFKITSKSHILNSQIQSLTSKIGYKR